MNISNEGMTPNLSSGEQDGKPDNQISDNYMSTPANEASGNNQIRQKRASLACIRCRSRHIKCPGGEPCKKCQLAKTKCEYVEADKKIVVSMKYLTKLHEDIARLKKDNAILRNELKKGNHDHGLRESPARSNSGSSGFGEDQGTQFRFAESPVQNTLSPFSHSSSSVKDEQTPPFPTGEVIGPSLSTHGRLIQSRTGERLFVGPSSMTLFGLEIQNMIPSSEVYDIKNDDFSHGIIDYSNTKGSPETSSNEHPSKYVHEYKRESEILEKEGNAYKITLSKTNTRPGLSVDFTLPSYSYAMLLVDTFINYNDGCFYFFNEGLVKRFLMNLYSGKLKDNIKILKRTKLTDIGPSADENSIKQDTDDDGILETIWFCKILLIFATGEMYLGTESDIHMKKSRFEMYGPKKTQAKEGNNKEKNTLPGSSYFQQASELFAGLFASGAIDNITKDGAIETVLLYAFYLQVADCTVASYFYFGLALRAALILGWHVDAGKDNLHRFELEHRRRIWWTVYMYERMLSSKAGLPLSFADDSVSTELPADVDVAMDKSSMDEEDDVRAYFIFPPHEYIKNCVTITQTNGVILSSLYTRQPTVNILPVVANLVQKLVDWKNNLPNFLNYDFASDDVRISRLIVNLMTEYFQGVNLAVRPLLYHFATKKLKDMHGKGNANKYVDLSKYSRNVISLLNSSFQASINTIKAIWALVPDNMVALFGWMDREYLFTSACTLILFNTSFGVHEATKEHLDHALTIFRNMKKLGNYPASIRRAQLLKLIDVLDFNRVMSDLTRKHNDEYTASGLVPKDKASFRQGQEKGHDNTPYSFAEPMPDINYTGINKLASQFVASNKTPNPTNNSVTISESPSAPSILSSDKPISLEKSSLNFDLTNIEGFTFMDDEQKLWNEITNDAVWLNVANGPSSSSNNLFDFSMRDEAHIFNSDQLMHNTRYNDSNNANSTPGSFKDSNHLVGDYADIISEEFQDSMTKL
ncbi:Piso0_005030 [Millerozyma farinosa CBS 7064]|uniref:Piso0_005030 protein n=1 Tax=Pichia sorbitophila (strain ATCC MYA-4447 / BCRC 22081 / CBS 7064 / NBRC 10061 / NRRL Y-12695) TaxID=559304 RepID=G8Y132_PICSO|nr:Piso0_005030 [Millerozyma farinosa CBS 7064]